MSQRIERSIVIESIDRYLDALTEANYAPGVSNRDVIRAIQKDLRRKISWMVLNGKLQKRIVLRAKSKAKRCEALWDGAEAS